MSATTGFRRVRGLAAVFGLSLSFLIGCGGTQDGTLSGTVTYQGKNLKGGDVIVLAADGKMVRAKIGADGSYTAPGVPPGEAKIGVDTGSAKPIKLPKGAKLPEKGPDGQPYNPGIVTDKDLYTKLPPQFSDPTKSGLTVKVTGGAQKHDIPIP
jgi:hypothetical protein